MAKEEVKKIVEEMVPIIHEKLHKEIISSHKKLKEEGKKKLAETDYLALSDNTLADNMKTYRQELRDVPTQSDPDNITWPTKP